MSRQGRSFRAPRVTPVTASPSAPRRKTRRSPPTITCSSSPCHAWEIAGGSAASGRARHDHGGQRQRGGEEERDGARVCRHGGIIAPRRRVSDGAPSDRTGLSRGAAAGPISGTGDASTGSNQVSSPHSGTTELSVRRRGLERRIHKEAVMATPRRTPLVVLGWQTWSIVVVVLVLVLLAGTYILFW